MPQLDRRSFLKVTGSTAAGAVATGCYRYSDLPQKLIPYVVQQGEQNPVGIPVFYASTCTGCGAGCGLHVKTREARPIKLEGNPGHPVNRGALCAHGQAMIGHTYSPDRHPGPRRRNGDAFEPIPWDEATALLAEKIRANPGGTYVLGRDPGPTASDVIERFVEGVGAGGRVVYDPSANEALRAATKQVFGVASEPHFDLSGADLVLDFGSDFLEHGSPVEHARQLAEARAVGDHPDGGARLVYVGPRMSMTASKADEWVPARPGTEGVLALAIARAAVQAGAGEAITGLAPFDAASAAEKTGVPAETIERLGRAVAQAKSAVALPPGVALTGRRAVANAAAVLMLNHVAGAQGKTLFVPDAPRGPVASHRDLSTLIDAMKAGRVSVLLVHDANPLYSIPADQGFAEALAQVPFVVSFATSADETSEAAHLVLPDASGLESWGDHEARPGVRSLVQPTVSPLYDTKQTEDVLLEVGRTLGASMPEGTFRDVLEAAWAGSDFRAALQRGGEFSDAPAPPVRGLVAGAASLEVGEPPLEGEGELVLLTHPHPLLGDGRGANLPWLQEVADPVTKVAWTSWAEIHSETAEEMGVEHGDVVSITTPVGRVEVPVVPRGGIRKDVVALALGQGHTVGHYASAAVDGRPGEKRGVNALDLLPARADENGGRALLTVRAKLEATGGHKAMPVWQKNDNKRGRLLGQQVSLLALAKGEKGAAYPSHGPDEAHGGDHAGDEHAGETHAGASGDHTGGGAAAAAHGEGPDPHLYKPYDPANDSEVDAYRWGMSIDVDRCTGCSACIAACYIENNVPIVGERQTTLGRHMAWLRIERYVGEGEPVLEAGRNPIESREELGKTDIRNSPMLCQQCGSAPCEPVCPVFATYHNEEGLNGMVYNRCIGTRYCANNCSYKVRRFNWYDYQIETWPDPMPLMLNPDVTVRGQGVMEKCTFCVQRVQEGRQRAKDEGRPIADGEVVTACQQSCPTDAIRFGNLKDPQAAVVRASEDPVRGYRALHDLNTRPAITYLAQVERGKIEG